MFRYSLAALALLALAPLAAPAQADDEGAPNWWMVYDRSAPDEAQLVDLNSFKNSDIGTLVETMTVYESGRAVRDIKRVNCLQPTVESEVQAFVCGSHRYRSSHGESVPDPTPSSIVALIPHNGDLQG